MEQKETARLFSESWRLSRAYHGNSLSVHMPGMFVVNGRRGKYRAVSITGTQCELNCEHCKGSLLKTMAHACSGDSLYRLGMEAHARGDLGMLVSGGCDSTGRLPWQEFLPAIRRLKQNTNLVITVHAGTVDAGTAAALKEAGTDQALVDVIGDEETARQVYHLPAGTAGIRGTLEALRAANLEVVPHIVFGLHYGEEKGEWQALRMLSDFPLTRYVVVVLTPMKGTPMAGVTPPGPVDVARFLARARIELPGLKAHLGCARPRGRYRRELDVQAIRAGINAIAIPCDAALEEAEAMGLEISVTEGCCSLAGFGSP
ncbi:MAG: radical SAM protein [Thermodesulfobacteriota bacterium]